MPKALPSTSNRRRSKRKKSNQPRKMYKMRNLPNKLSIPRNRELGTVLKIPPRRDFGDGPQKNTKIFKKIYKYAQKYKNYKRINT